MKARLSVPMRAMHAATVMARALQPSAGNPLLRRKQSAAGGGAHGVSLGWCLLARAAARGLCLGRCGR
jgi:hypothetical protein